MSSITAVKLRQINELKLSEITTAEIKMIPDNKLQQAVYHLKTFFQPARYGNILLNGKECSYYYAFRKDKITVSDIAEKLKTIDSLHYSLSLFRGFKRKYSEALSNTGTTIDLDYYNVPELSSLTPEQVIEKMKREGLFDDPAVQPNYFISSGGGLYLVYLMENINVNPRQDHDLKKATVEQNIEKRREITKALIRHFEEYGSDNKCHDLTRINKLAGTVNLKNGNTTRILDFEKVINKNHKPRTLGHWYNHFVEKGCIVEEQSKTTRKIEITEEVKTTKQKEKKSNKKQENSKRKQFINTYRKKENMAIVWNAHTLNIARVDDMQTLLSV